MLSMVLVPEDCDLTLVADLFSTLGELLLTLLVPESFLKPPLLDVEVLTPDCELLLTDDEPEFLMPDSELLLTDDPDVLRPVLFWFL